MAARPLDRFFSALPDAITAGYFLTLWIDPLRFGDHGVRNGMPIMRVEFIVIHASGFLGSTALVPDTRRSSKLKLPAGFSAFYLRFIAAWSFTFQAWWSFVAFDWLIAFGGLHFSVLAWGKGGDIVLPRKHLPANNTHGS